MTFKIIRSKRDYTTALERFEQIFQAKAGTPESDEADVLALLIKSYEDTHYPIEIPDPLAAIQYRMEQQGLSKQELASILGYKSRVTDLVQRSPQESEYDSQAACPLEYLLRYPCERVLT